MATRQTSKLKEVTSKQLRCNLALTGEAPDCKLCPYCYECATCPFDQMLDDMVPVFAGVPSLLQAHCQA